MSFVVLDVLRFCFMCCVIWFSLCVHVWVRVCLFIILRADVARDGGRRPVCMRCPSVCVVRSESAVIHGIRWWEEASRVGGLVCGSLCSGSGICVWKVRRSGDVCVGGGGLHAWLRIGVPVLALCCCLCCF